MKMPLDCLPCMLRQVLEAAGMATKDSVIQEKIMEEAAALLPEFRQYRCAPEMCEVLHAVVRRHTGVSDPYAAVKARDIATALRFEPLLTRYAGEDGHPLERLLKIAATGNVMDSAVYGGQDMESRLVTELELPFAADDFAAFREQLEIARTVLILGDNAGEVVFDKLLTRYLSGSSEVYYAVRGGPALNDATVEDAIRTGIGAYATLVSTGCTMPGTLYEACDPDFRQLFDRADLVISKGQGNYEALSEVPRGLFFLLKAKCAKIAASLGVEQGAYVFRAHNV
ncbi:MAG: DUF89 family protein [Clostridiaceae bacterium]|nr:DUF89 family protein [Clostridiaceae bacterium]